MSTLSQSYTSTLLADLSSDSQSIHLLRAQRSKLTSILSSYRLLQSENARLQKEVRSLRASLSSSSQGPNSELSSLRHALQLSEATSQVWREKANHLELENIKLEELAEAAANNCDLWREKEAKANRELQYMGNVLEQQQQKLEDTSNRLAEAQEEIRKAWERTREIGRVEMEGAEVERHAHLLERQVKELMTENSKLNLQVVNISGEFKSVSNSQVRKIDELSNELRNSYLELESLIAELNNRGDVIKMQERLIETLKIRN